MLLSHYSGTQKLQNCESSRRETSSLDSTLDSHPGFYVWLILENSKSITFLLLKCKSSKSGLALFWAHSTGTSTLVTTNLQSTRTSPTKRSPPASCRWSCPLGTTLTAGRSHCYLKTLGKNDIEIRQVIISIRIEIPRMKMKARKLTAKNLGYFKKDQSRWRVE